MSREPRRGFNPTRELSLDVMLDSDDSDYVLLDSDWLMTAEGSRVFDSDWLPRRVVSVQCIKIWSREPKADSMY